MFFAQPHPDPVRGVPLVSRRLPVALQHPVNRLLHWIEFWLFPFMLLLSGGIELAIA